jgi:hypothetical protein
MGDELHFPMNIDQLISGVPFEENFPCDRCGQFGSFKFQGASLCQNCYESCGSCCPEFGADDLWTTNKPDEKPSA